MAGDTSGGGGLSSGCAQYIAGLTVSAVALAAVGVYLATHHDSGQQSAAPSPSPPASASAGSTSGPSSATCPRGGGAVEFQDPGYGDTAWSDSMPASTTLSGASFQVTGGPLGSGPDGKGYRATRLAFAGKGVLVVLHLPRASLYDPAACGPITAVDASFGVQDLGSSGPAPVPPEPLARAQSVDFAVRQGGVVYWTPTANAVAAAPSWTPVSATTLWPQEFNDYLGLHGGHPNFSAGLLEFGYVTISRCAVRLTDPPCAQEETSSALGGWHVTLHR